MFVGRFEMPFSRPTIDCFISIPQLNVQGVVPFLLDTGADCTTLMPIDQKRLGILEANLAHAQQTVSYGIGGACVDYLCPAALVFKDQDVGHAYRQGLYIAKRTDENEDMPSLLGRDILKNWRIAYDQHAGTIEVEVRISDEELLLDGLPF